MKRIFNIILLALAGIISTQAADVVIKGTVIAAEDGEPLIGATVVVTAKELKNAGSSKTNVSTMTDIDGHFSLAIPEGVKHIESRYVGYGNTSVALTPGQTEVVIKMTAAATELSEVVVTG